METRAFNCARLNNASLCPNTQSRTCSMTFLRVREYIKRMFEGRLNYRASNRMQKKTKVVFSFYFESQKRLNLTEGSLFKSGRNK